MRIASFQTMAVRIPREPGQFAPREQGDFVTLRLRTDDGVEGISYAGFTSPLATKALKEMLDALAAETVGADPHAVEEIGRGLLGKAGDGSPAGIVTRAVSAIDVALWDIRGKALDMPVWRLLGAGSGAVPTYASGHLWRRDGLDTLAEAAAELAGQGFRAMKLRLGGETSAKAEVARLCAVREVVGEGVDVMVDINQGWDVNRTIAVGRSMAEHNLFWLEDPIHFQDYTGLARIAEALDTPIAVGEYHYGIEPFRHMLAAGSIDIVMVDLLTVGGITQWMKVAHLAEAYNLPVVTHLTTEILGHTLAAAPNGLYVEHMPWAFPLFEEVPQVDAATGRLMMPDEPGLGLRFDEARLAASAL